MTLYMPATFGFVHEMTSVVGLNDKKSVFYPESATNVAEYTMSAALQTKFAPSNGSKVIDY